MKMRRIIEFFIILFSCSSITAGEYIVKSKVDSVSRDGFYKIILSPEIISASKVDYEDIRLYNSHDIEVPYLFSAEQRAAEVTGFKEYPVLENRNIPKQKITRIVVHNKEKSIISTLYLIVRNSEIEKDITLKGSDDQKSWFIIQRNFPLKTIRYNATSGLMELTFPNSDYEYLELSLDDKKKDPIQVLKVGYYDSKEAKGLYSELPVKDINQKDSANKNSYITIRLDRSFEINKLELNVSGPELFLRSCYVGRKIMHNKKSEIEILEQFKITSSSPAVWEMEKIKTDELIIVIENSDNAPLKVNTVKAFQLNKYLIAKLISGESYEVRAGNDALNAPDYDLKYFADSIPEGLQTLKTLKASFSDPAKPITTKSIFSKTVLWVIIILVIVLLAFLSIRLVKEMGKKE